jgi:hypothetical protein
MALIFPESISNEKYLKPDDKIILKALEQNLSEEWEFYAFTSERQIQFLFVVNPEWGVFVIRLWFMEDKIYQNLRNNDSDIKRIFDLKKDVLENAKRWVADELSKVFPNKKIPCSINYGLIIKIQSKYKTLQKTDVIKTLINRSIILDTINDKEILADIENSLISLVEEEDFEELSINDINSITKSFSKIIESLTYQTKIDDQKNGKPIWWSSLDDVWQKTLSSCAEGTQRTKYIHSHIYTNTSLSEQRRSAMVDHIMRWGIPNWTSDQITLESILDIDFISFGGNEFSDIEPIQYLKKLHTFIMDSTNIRDLSPLSNLPNLKHISITNSPVRDFEPIRKLKNIEMILVPDIGIHDIKSFRDKYPLI